MLAVLALTAVLLGIGGAGAAQVSLLLREGGIALVVPLATLMFAVAGLGDLHDDGTLVYLWARPVPRWLLAVAATVATILVALVANVGALVAVPLLGGLPELAPAAAVAAVGGTVAYAAVFVALGLRTKRALLWGLAYLVLFEGFLARFSQTLSAASIRRSVEALLVHLGDLGGTARLPSLSGAVTTLVVATALGVAATAWWLSRRDVP
ncbi:hypothetical protein FTX61_15340 [Nitriliruptoraceae bacterium ZYF776]|nr:hypothetical protein [Profundirhabdus halotolerans]